MWTQITVKRKRKEDGKKRKKKKLTKYKSWRMDLGADMLHVRADADVDECGWHGCGWWWRRMSGRKKEKEKELTG